MSAVPSSSPQVTHSSPARVLIVDDEKLIADTLAIIFRQAGYEALAAYNAADGIRASESFLPDLLLTDAIMPDSDGLLLAAAIRDRLPSCQILLISGQPIAAERLRRAYALEQTFEVMEKPIHPLELLAKARTMVPEHLGRTH